MLAGTHLQYLCTINLKYRYFSKKDGDGGGYDEHGSEGHRGTVVARRVGNADHSDLHHLMVLL